MILAITVDDDVLTIIMYKLDTDQDLREERLHIITKQWWRRGSPNKQVESTNYTVNGERFAGLNLRGFHGFWEYRKSFPMNF